MRQPCPSATGSCRPAPGLRRRRRRSRRGSAHAPSRRRSRPGRSAPRRRRGFARQAAPNKGAAGCRRSPRACRRFPNPCAASPAANSRDLAVIIEPSSRSARCRGSFPGSPAARPSVRALRRNKRGKVRRLQPRLHSAASPALSAAARDRRGSPRGSRLHLGWGSPRRSCGRDRARQRARKCPSPPPCRARSG